MRFNGGIFITLFLLITLTSSVTVSHYFIEQNNKSVNEIVLNEEEKITELIDEKYSFNDQFSEQTYDDTIQNHYFTGALIENQNEAPEKPYPFDKTNNYFASNNKDSIPNSWDWRYIKGFDWTTSIRDQGNCGSCWAFAALGALESVINIAENKSYLNHDLSEQYILSCLSSAGSCNGGWVSEAYRSIKSTSEEGNNYNGVIPETCMQYKSIDDFPCSSKCSDWIDKLVPISDYGIMYNPSIDEVKQIIIDNGPVAAFMKVYYDFYSYEGGIYSHSWGEYQGGHAIVIVGFNDSGNYWVCKNSWGSIWGEDGWFNIAYGDSSIASIIYWVTYNSDMGKTVADASGPYYADVNEIIEFDGSNSYSSQGIIDYYRWDFNSDGIWDTDLLNTSLFQYSYSSQGNYTVTLQVMDNIGMIDNDTTTAVIERYPIAKTNGPFVAEPDEIIFLDGSNSTSTEYNIDFYEWSAEKPSTITDNEDGDPYANVSFSKPGKYWIKLTVRNNTGISNSVFTKAMISNAPSSPTHPTPRHASKGIDIDQEIRWLHSIDAENDDVCYDLYFCEDQGTTKETIEQLNSVDSLVIEDLNEAMFYPGSIFESNTLEHGTTYFWRVVAKENHGLTTFGPIWNFTTAERLPDIEIIDILGGNQGVQIVVYNNDNIHQTFVEYSLKIIPDEDTELFEPINYEKKAFIMSIPSHQSVTLQTDKIVGYGSFQLEINIEGISDTYVQECFIVYDYVSIGILIVEEFIEDELLWKTFGATPTDNDDDSWLAIHDNDDGDFLIFDRNGDGLYTDDYDIIVVEDDSWNDKVDLPIKYWDNPCLERDENEYYFLFDDLNDDGIYNYDSEMESSTNPDGQILRLYLPADILQDQSNLEERFDFAYTIDGYFYMDNNQNGKFDYPINVNYHSETISPSDDSFIAVDIPDLVKDDVNVMSIRNKGDLDAWEYNPFIKFDLSSIPDDAKIISSRLYLFYSEYKDRNPSGHELMIYRVIQDWEEELLTWNTQPETTSIVTSSSLVPSQNESWMVWDVASDVNLFIKNNENNYGWKIIDETFTSGSNIPLLYFNTKENVINHPYLIIDYEIRIS